MVSLSRALDSIRSLGANGGWPLLAAASGPAFAWIIVSAMWLAGAALGIPHAIDGGTMTLPEATAVASYADAARLLAAGADPNAAAKVRAGIVDLHVHTMTPLEAATGAVRTGPVQMLVEHGAVIDQHNFAVLWCAAEARRNLDMLRFLGPRRPNGAAVECGTVRSLW